MYYSFGVALFDLITTQLLYAQTMDTNKVIVGEKHMYIRMCTHMQPRMYVCLCVNWKLDNVYQLVICFINMFLNNCSSWSIAVMKSMGKKLLWLGEEGRKGEKIYKIIITLYTLLIKVVFNYSCLCAVADYVWCTCSLSQWKTCVERMFFQVEVAAGSLP